ncbi:cobalamin-binding protein [Oceanisphaera avium]|uniref:Cobalamin-binding protein n=1 Tax=Oceanisphaera avium TaxID=1903694 RepID=A0A1Y0D1D6_9GAMM|nr:cobalamin-binding protein [Oceanisphaera avium]
MALLLYMAVSAPALADTSFSGLKNGQHLKDKPAQRIITIVPHATELLFAIGAGSQVIATDEASDYPAGAKTLPKVANYRSLNTERILALQPDLIVAWGAAQQQAVQPLVQLGIAVFLSEPATFKDLSTELKKLGELTGHSTQAAKVINDYEHALAQLSATFEQRRPVRVFYQVAEVPLMSANNSTWMGQAVRMCGGENIMAQSLAPYPQVNVEQVIAQNPEAIVGASAAELKHWQQWPMLSAVQNQHLLSIDANLLHRFGPRITQGITQLCQQLEAVRSASSID